MMTRSTSYKGDLPSNRETVSKYNGEKVKGLKNKLKKTFVDRFGTQVGELPLQPGWRSARLSL